MAGRSRIGKLAVHISSTNRKQREKKLEGSREWL